MKLTIERLITLSSQDLIDLAKIWPGQTAAQWLSCLEGSTLLFAARFNDRLLGAVKIDLQGELARLQDLKVREVTRRRGVGLYLIQEVQRQLPEVLHWQLSIAELPVAERAGVEHLMQACGFIPVVNEAAAVLATFTHPNHLPE